MRCCCDVFFLSDFSVRCGSASSSLSLAPSSFFDINIFIFSFTTTRDSRYLHRLHLLNDNSSHPCFLALGCPPCRLQALQSPACPMTAAQLSSLRVVLSTALVVDHCGTQLEFFGILMIILAGLTRQSDKAGCFPKTAQRPLCGAMPCIPGMSVCV